jgi:1-acyl-sn-glycerol-3-phosphate acyltransferase
VTKLLSLYLWVVGFIYITAFLVVTILACLLFDPRVYNTPLKRMLRYLFKVLHISVRVEGAENIKSDVTYLFMSNHVSIFDMPVLGGFIPGFVRGLEAERQFRWPLYGTVTRCLGNIPINRENVFRAMKGIKAAEKWIKGRRSLLILPEGHRTLDGRLRPFKRLPFYLAKRVGVDIAPIGLSGLFGLKSKGSWIIRPAPLKIKFGPIIPASLVRRLSDAELRDLTHERIKELIEWP